MQDIIKILAELMIANNLSVQTNLNKTNNIQSEHQQMASTILFMRLRVRNILTIVMCSVVTIKILCSIALGMAKSPFAWAASLAVW